MGTRITGDGDKPKKPKRTVWEKYPDEVSIGCMNRAHPDIVNFVIPRGKKQAACPKCGRKVSRG